MDIVSLIESEEPFFDPSFSLERIGMLRGHKWVVDDMALLPDGHSLLVSIQRGHIEQHLADISLWDIYQKRRVRSIGDAPQVVYDLAVSPRDGAIVLAGETISFWTDQGVQRKRTIPCRAQRLTFSADGALLYALDAHGTVSCWNTLTQTLHFSFQALEGQDAWTSDAGTLALSNDGSYLAITGARGKANIWLLEAHNREALLVEQVSTAFYGGVACSPDSTFFATVTMNRLSRRPKHTSRAKDTYSVLRLYALPTLQLWADLPIGHLEGTGRKTTMVFSPDSTLLAFVDKDGRLLIWDVLQEKLLASFQAHPDPVDYFARGIECVIWSRQGDLLLTAGWDPTEAKKESDEFVISIWSVKHAKR